MRQPRLYRQALRDYVYPAIGARKLADVQRRDVQRIADAMLANSASPSTIRNALMPLRVIYRRAIEDGDIAVNPCERLRLPSVEGRRDRIADPSEAAKLIAVVPIEHRALWATAFYGGLRRGELQAVRWEDINLGSGTLRVGRSWDAKAGAIDPKSRSGRRTVPIPGVLRDHLVEHRMRQGRDKGLVFGTSVEQPFTPSNVRRRAERAWQRARTDCAVELARADGRDFASSSESVRHRYLERAGFDRIGPGRSAFGCCEPRKSPAHPRTRFRTRLEKA